MFTVCEGTEAPTFACAVIDVGETESCPCADACVEKITRVTTQRNRLMNRDEVRIGLLYELQTRSKADRHRDTARSRPTTDSPGCKGARKSRDFLDAATTCRRNSAGQSYKIVIDINHDTTGTYCCLPTAGDALGEVRRIT